MRSMLFVLLLVAAVAFGESVARADLAPPDSCSSPGQPCQNAGASNDQAGTCVATTCTKQVRGADGGLTPMTYSCNACQLTGAAGNSGAGGSSGAAGNSGAGGSSGGTGAGGAPTKTSSGSSGCSVVGETGAGPGSEALFGLVVAGLAVARPRRRTSV